MSNNEKSQSVTVDNAELVPVTITSVSAPSIPVLAIPIPALQQAPMASLLVPIVGASDMNDSEIARVAAKVASEVAAKLATARVEQDALHSASQRKVNLIWEYTQMTVALTVVVIAMGVSAYLALTERSEQIPTILSVAFGTVVGFYFGRTNHQSVGGVQLGR